MAWGSRPLHALIVSIVFITSTPAVSRPIISVGERCWTHTADIYSLFVTSLVSAGCKGEGAGRVRVRQGRQRGGIIYIDHRTKIYDYKH